MAWMYVPDDWAALIHLCASEENNGCALFASLQHFYLVFQWWDQGLLSQSLISSGIGESPIFSATVVYYIEVN